MRVVGTAEKTTVSGSGWVDNQAETQELVAILFCWMVVFAVKQKKLSVPTTRVLCVRERLSGEPQSRGDANLAFTIL